MRFRGRRARVAAIGLALLLVACGDRELYTKLSEAQANEMIAVLQSAGIDASKKDGGEAGWTLSTSDGDFAHAIQVLHAQGYPRDDFASLCTVFKKEGFVSSPTEEQARLNCALSQELSHSISQIDGVVQARVHLALPENQPLAEHQQPASASVFIKYRPGSNIDAQVGKVKALIVNSVPALTVDNVSVETFPAEPLPVAPVSVTGRAFGAGLLWIVAAVAALLAALFAYPRVRRWSQRRTALVRREPSA